MVAQVNLEVEHSYEVKVLYFAGFVDQDSDLG